MQIYRLQTLSQKQNKTLLPTSSKQQFYIHFHVFISSIAVLSEHFQFWRSGSLLQLQWTNLSPIYPNCYHILSPCSERIHCSKHKNPLTLCHYFLEQYNQTDLPNYFNIGWKYQHADCIILSQFRFLLYTNFLSRLTRSQEPGYFLSLRT